jgi:hypothetical protein
VRLLSLISGKGFVMYSKVIAKEVSINGAIVFGQLSSSYESFSNKNMITIRNGKEYFFLTSETLQKETSLSYKQQLKAIKELEASKLIITDIFGTPSKKYFHITNQIELLFGRPSYDKRETLDCIKGQGKVLQKGSTIKENNKKEQVKDINIKNLVNKEPKITINDTIQKACNKLYSKYSTGRWNKKQWNTLITKFILEIVENNRCSEMNQKQIELYVDIAISNMAYHHDIKNGKVKMGPEKPTTTFYNWIEERD